MYFMIVFKVMPHLKESVEVLPLKIIFFPHSLNTLWCPLVYQSTVGGNTFTCPYTKSFVTQIGGRITTESTPLSQLSFLPNFQGQDNKWICSAQEMIDKCLIGNNSLKWDPISRCQFQLLPPNKITRHIPLGNTSVLRQWGSKVPIYFNSCCWFVKMFESFFMKSS